MKVPKLSDLAIVLFLLFGTIVQGQDPIDYVDVFVGTSGDHGQMDPAATVPFGMVKLGPDTHPLNHSGYNYDAEYIIGFSHNRISGVGCRGTGGNLRILPGISPSSDKSKYLKASETASPGYYSVKLDNDILVQLTASNNTGVHRYTFPKTKEANITIDYASSFAGTYNASYALHEQGRIDFKVAAKNVCGVGRYTSYFSLLINKEQVTVNEMDGKLVLTFPTKKNEVVELRVGLSPISTETAFKEMNHQPFEQLKHEAAASWQSILSKIKIEGKETYKNLFYTHLYHTMLNPVKSSDKQGNYRGTDGKLYHGNYTHFDTWSMWDNFRNKFSLYALLIPDEASAMAMSLVDLYANGRSKWTGFFEPAPSVRTEHSAITLLDLHRRGIKGIDFGKAYEQMAYEASYIEKHSPDTRLENAYDYWALAQIAGELDKTEDQKVFQQFAASYKKGWKKDFLNLEDDADIMHARGLYEGTLWQYRWHVQFDLPGIIELIGGDEAFTGELSHFFDNDFYNHGNQPDLHAPFLFNYSKAPWLSQYWVNKILTKDMVQAYGTHNKWEKPYFGKIYKDDPKGYISEMDDDEGTMSSWYVLASMGLYPVHVGEPVFQVTTPIFDKITIALQNKNTFTIETEGFSEDSFYIKSATLNGKPFNRSYLRHSEIMAGGVFKLILDKEPNKTWGIED